jgi:transcription elongation GreA/GreB family factor
MKEEFEKLVAAGKVNAGDVDILFQLYSEGCCMHKSWGFGEVKTVDVVLGKMTVDFSGRPGHVIDLAFAPKILAPISKSHIEARKAMDMKGLKEMAGSDHHGVIKVIIDSYGILATADRVQTVLVPEVIEKDDFKKWWETARKEMKKDGHFVLPTKKSEPLEYQSQDIPLQERLLQEFNSARGLKARLVVVGEMAKSARDLDDAPALAGAAMEKLNEEIESHARTKPGLALEAVMVLDDLAQALGAEVSAEAPDDSVVWAAEPNLAKLVAGMPMARQGRALEFYQASHEGWAEVFIGMINTVPARLVGECIGLLCAAGKKEALLTELGQLVNHHAASGELLLWLAKDKSGDFAEILTPEAFGAMLSAIERETSDLKRASKLRDFLLNDPDILETLIRDADMDVVEDIARAIQMSTCFEGMDKRSVLGKIVKAYPEIQEFITHGEKEKEAQPADTGVIVSWDSLARRKEKLEELVTSKIPANSKDIEIAREYGDLRENAEFKAAKEHQKVLMTQRTDLENEIENARAINYSDASTEAANVGTRVIVTNLDTGIREEFALLGAWDGDPDNNRISYLTPMGQAIIGRAPGEEVEVQLGDQSRRLRVDGIAPYAAEQAPA